MKKFIVLRKIGIFKFEEDRQFDDIEDAKTYRQLCQQTEENPRVLYAVAEIV